MPERVVSRELAGKLLHNQFPNLVVESIEEFGEGFDNTIFLVNKKFVFRFPRREIAMKLLQTEAKLLPLLAGQLPLTVPEPVYFGRESKEYPWSFIGYNLVEGVVPKRITAAQRIGMAKPLALFLKDLHQTSLSKIKQIPVPYDEFFRLDIGKRKVKLLENILILQSNDNIELYKRAEKYALSLQPIQLEKIEVLTHGDLHIRNMIVDEKGQLAGVIDWGDSHIGHPAVDLSIIFSMLPSASRPEFFQIYGEVNEATIQLAQFKAVYTTVVLLSYALDKEDADLYLDAKNSLKFALNG
ncbi:phosphotransferase [Niallia sp. 01092]|uniref:phosphotransferase n=1 Tax=unclassified Niallia TaxID=2837522 RepID=UPI003FD3C82D